MNWSAVLTPLHQMVNWSAILAGQDSNFLEPNPAIGLDVDVQSILAKTCPSVSTDAKDPPATAMSIASTQYCFCSRKLYPMNLFTSKKNMSCKDKNTLDSSTAKNNTAQFKQATFSCEGVSAEKNYEASLAVYTCENKNPLHLFLTKTNSSQGVHNTSAQSTPTATNIVIQDTNLIHDKTKSILTIIQDDHDIQDGTLKEPKSQRMPPRITSQRFPHVGC